MNDQELIDALSARQRDAEAEAWYRRLGAADLQDKEWRCFIKWQSIPANQEAFDAVADRRELMLDAHRRSGSNRSATPHRLWRGLAAVVVVVCIHVTIVTIVTRYESPAEPRVLISTGESARWLLEDGSYIRAEPNTRVDVRFDEKHRSTRLRYGNAFFRVAKAPERPFVVSTGQAVVTAKGTAFEISLLGQDAMVNVTEGTVLVSPNPEQDPPAGVHFAAFELHNNQQARISPTSAARERSQLKKGTMTIQFHARPASEAMREFSERSGIQIRAVATSPALASPVSGIFEFDDPIKFARTVADEISSTVLVSSQDSVPLKIEPRR
jgi:transmembrane sensor